VELQSLVKSSTSYASPRRTATGIGINRLHQILAVLEKAPGAALSVSIAISPWPAPSIVEEAAGGIRLCGAVVTSFRDLERLAGRHRSGGRNWAWGRAVAAASARLGSLRSAGGRARLGFFAVPWLPRGSVAGGKSASELGLELLEAGPTCGGALVAALGVGSRRPDPGHPNPEVVKTQKGTVGLKPPAAGFFSQFWGRRCSCSGKAIRNRRAPEKFRARGRKQKAVSYFISVSPRSLRPGEPRWVMDPPPWFV